MVSLKADVMSRRERLLLVFGVIASLLLMIMGVLSSMMKREPVDVIYRALAAEMIRDVEKDPRYYVSSNNMYPAHRNFAKIVRLGRPVVPLLIAEMKDGNNRYQSLILDQILPDVDLGKLYGESDYKWHPDIHLKYWLRWWDEVGTAQRWDLDNAEKR